MRLLDADEMRAVDRAAIEDWGIPGLVLMENAALGVVDAMAERYPDAESVVVFCGPGNNGGDGLAVARHLSVRGYRTLVVLVGWSANRSDDAALQHAICQRQGLGMLELEGPDGLSGLAMGDLDADLWVDALFGTGLSRPLGGLFAEVVELLASASRRVVAVDLPSGLDASTGEIPGPAAAADLTVTFAAPKWPHVFRPAAERCGRVVVTDLGIPRAVLAEGPGSLELLVGEEVAACLMDRDPEAHKGSFGHCLLVAGSPGKSGAAILAARAAVASGAGLVTVGVPAPLLDTVEGGSLESMGLALSADRSGCLTVDSADEVLAAAAGRDAVALGPGLGTSGTTVTAVRSIVSACEAPLVLDADGINALVGATDLLRQRRAPTVLTPHPGEAARLFDSTVAEVQSARVDFAGRRAVELGVVLVLKGHQTLVATPDGEIFVNSSGNPGMGSGGTGDVLTGMLVALLGQGYEADVAACLAVFLHGLAGDLAAERCGLEGLRAGDLLERIPAAFSTLRKV